MTITTTPPTNLPYTTTGDGSTKTFSTSMQTTTNRDILVYLDGELQYLGTDYTVTIGTNTSITFITAPENNAPIIVDYNLDQLQRSTFVNYTTFPNQVLESATDKLTLQFAAQLSTLNRCPKIPAGLYTGANTPYPLGDIEASKYLKWNSDATELTFAARSQDTDNITNTSLTATTVNVTSTTAFQGALSASTITVGTMSVNANNGLRFYDADNSNYVTVNVPSTITSNLTLNLPTTDGTNGQALRITSANQLGWSTAPSITTGWFYVGEYSANFASNELNIPLPDSSYKTAIIEIYGLVRGASGAAFRIRTSTNGGSSYDSGGSDYRYDGGLATSFIALTGTGASTTSNMQIIINAPGTTKSTDIYVKTFIVEEASAGLGVNKNIGVRTSSQLVNYLKLYADTPAQFTGVSKVHVWGLK